MSVSQELIGQVGPDEPGAPRDQDLHLRLLLALYFFFLFVTFRS
jgi:hypothetical protein